MRPDVKVTPKDREVIALLLEGCDQNEMAKRMGIARRTVKQHLNRLYLRFGITDGVKRVKLAVIFFRSPELWNATAREN